MKKLIDRVFFVFRFSWKNIIKYPFRSLILCISLIIMLVVMLVSFSTRTMIENYFYMPLYEQYKDFNLMMSASQNSNTRYFSIQSLKQSDELSQYIQTYVPFFEIESLIEVRDLKLYVKTMAGNVNDLQKASDYKTQDEASLLGNETIITKSLALKTNLKIGDTITIVIGKESRLLRVQNIVDDGGLFSDDCIFVNKTSMLLLFMYAIDKEIGDYFSSLPSAVLDNIYNRIYIETKADVSPVTVISFLKSLPAYQKLDIIETISKTAIQPRIDRNIALMTVMLLFIFITVFLMMQTIYLLMFDEKKKTFAILDQLGTKTMFSFGVVFFELFSLFLLAMIIAIYVTNGIIRYGYIILHMNIAFSLSITQIINSSIIVLVLFSLTAFYYFRKSNKIKMQSYNNTKMINPKYLLLSLIILLCFIIVLFVIPYKNKYITIFQLFLILILLFLFPLTGFAFLGKTKNQRSLKRLYLKMVVTKNSFYYYTAIVLISMLSIFLLVGSNQYQKSKIREAQEAYNVDFALSNIINSYDNIFMEINNIEEVESCDSVLLLQNVSFKNIEENISQLVSLDASSINAYFNFEIDNTTLEKLQAASVPAILLHKRLQALYSLTIGEVIKLDLGHDLGIQSFAILEFFDKGSDNIAFTNFHLVTETKPNAILINSKANRNSLREQLINDYSQYLVYVIDFQEKANLYAKEITIIYNYITYILVFIMACFLLSIFNHSLLLYEQIKDTHARLHILGVNSKELGKMILAEEFATFLVMILAVFGTVVLIDKILPDLFMVFGEYEAMHLSSWAWIYGFCYCSLTYLLSKSIYFYRLLKIDNTTVIKAF